MLDRNAATLGSEEIIVARDRRADGGARRVRVTRHDILIARRLAGIAMVITVPTSAYRGVALDVRAAGDGGASYRLSLAHRDPDLDVVLAETRDSGAAAADWRYWASFLDLPRLAGAEGDLSALERPQDARAKTLAPPRRQGSATLKRRPRFLSRRKAGDAARLQAVFTDEREIICYE